VFRHPKSCDAVPQLNDASLSYMQVCNAFAVVGVTRPDGRYSGPVFAHLATAAAAPPTLRGSDNGHARQGTGRTSHWHMVCFASVCKGPSRLRFVPYLFKSGVQTNARNLMTPWWLCRGRERLHRLQNPHRVILKLASLPGRLRIA
jgi:hypothetical protein